MRTHSVIFSDTHLENSNSRWHLLLQVLWFYPEARIIVAGDLQNHQGQTLPPESSLDLLLFLRQEKKRVAYISGNHDPLTNSAVAQFIGQEPVDKIEWQVGGRRFCAMHGHQFDRFGFVFKAGFVDSVFMAMMRAILVLDRKKKHIAGWTDNFHKFLAEKCAKQAARFARKRGYDVLICGHTHIPMYQRYFYGNREVAYFNSGSWISNPCSFVEVLQNGAVHLRMVYS